jgi:hypothetical protein
LSFIPYGIKIIPRHVCVDESAKGISYVVQIDLKHINQESESGDKVEVGIDLREYYPSVEWDILGVPAERHEKYYPCCAEPYPGNTIKILNCYFHLIL